MSVPSKYLLDGQPIQSIQTLCRAKGWPRSVVTEALRSSSTMTTEELRQIVVAHRCKTVVRPVREASRKSNAMNVETYLTKQARIAPIRFGSGVR